MFTGNKGLIKLGAISYSGISWSLADTVGTIDTTAQDATAPEDRSHMSVKLADLAGQFVMDISDTITEPETGESYDFEFRDKHTLITGSLILNGIDSQAEVGAVRRLTYNVTVNGFAEYIGVPTNLERTTIVLDTGTLYNVTLTWLKQYYAADDGQTQEIWVISKVLETDSYDPLSSEKDSILWNIETDTISLDFPLNVYGYLIAVRVKKGTDLGEFSNIIEVTENDLPS